MTDERRDEIRLFRKMRRRMVITWICWGVAMVGYPLATRTVGVFPLWMVGWLASLIGWWNWYNLASPLGMYLKEEIEHLERKEKEDKVE